MKFGGCLDLFAGIGAFSVGAISSWMIWYDLVTIFDQKLLF